MATIPSRPGLLGRRPKPTEEAYGEWAVGASPVRDLRVLRTPWMCILRLTSVSAELKAGAKIGVLVGFLTCMVAGVLVLPLTPRSTGADIPLRA